MDLLFILKVIILLAAISANAFLASVVYKNNPKSSTNRLYLGLGIIINLWLIANFTSVIPALIHQSLWLIRLSLFFATIMSAFFYLFAVTLPKEEFATSRIKLNIIVGLTFLVCVLTLSPAVFSRINIVNNSPEPVPGPGIGIFSTVTTVFSLLAVRVLYKKFRHSKGLERQQFSFALLAISVLLGLIILTVLLPVVLLKINIAVSFIPLYTVAFLGITTYSIIRHHLFDIRAVIAKSITYVLLFITLVGLYGVFAFQISSVIFDTSKISRLQKILNVVIALALGFSLSPLKRFFEKITDRVFFRDKYDPQSLLNEVSHILASEIDMKNLTTKVSQVITQQMRIGSAKIVVIDKDNIIFGAEIFSSTGSEKVDDITVLGKSHVFIDSIFESPLKNFMEKHEIRASIPLRTRDDFVGYLLLGEKLNGEVYNHADQQVLIILAAELAVAISNAKAYLEIKQFNITLQQKVDLATKELRSTNEKLRQIDATKDEFISMASHQLRTPLTSVKGYMSMVLEGDAGKITAQQRKLLQQSFVSSQRMVYLIADLLNISRLKTGKFVIESNPTNLADVVEGELAQLKETAEGRNLELTYQKPKSFPLLMLDETKIRQVIMNFVDNAIYYTPSGGHVVVELKDNENTVDFTVTDDGLGVPKAEQPHLFTKFYRAGNAKKARPDGTGLGLFMAKKVIVAQGGAIIFKSEEGKGSVFGFSFEKAKLKAPAKAAASPTAQAAQKELVIS